MKRRIYLILVIFGGLSIVAGFLLTLRPVQVAAKAAPEQTQVIKDGLAFLKTQQQPDGGILGFSGVSDPDATARTLLAFITSGEEVSGVVSTQGNSLLDYLSTQAISFTQDSTGTLFPGRVGILLSAVSLGGSNPADFGHLDLVSDLEATLNSDTGAYSTTAKQDFSSGAASDPNQVWSILGLSLAGRQIPVPATQYLVLSQAPDGSWGMGDPDTTALAATALIASRNVDVQSETIQNALKYFHSTQLANGGWRPSWDTDPLNADSTGWILQALVSAGEDPTDASWTKEGGNPIQALAGLQKKDGSIGGTYANAYSTAEAILGLSEKPLASLGISLVVHRAALAVYSGDNALFTKCVSFTESSISGLELLQRSGLTIETATDPSQGTAVCKIGDVGSPSDNCFGGMPNYWAYWQLGPNGWEYAVTGAEQSKVVDGDINGWSWGTGNPPLPVTFQNICEGVAIVLPTITQTSLPPTHTPQPMDLVIPTQVPPTSQPMQPANPQTGVGQYVVYGAIIVVLGALVFYVIRGRSR